MFEIFAVGTIWFWILICTIVVVELLCAANNAFYGGIGFIVGFGVVFAFGGALTELGSFIYAHPFITIGYAAAYLAIGFLWTFVKWWRYVAKRQEPYNKARAEFVKYHDLDPDEPIDKALLDSFRISFGRGKLFELQSLTVEENMVLVCDWILFWPFSMVVTLLDDPMRKLIVLGIVLFKSVYKKIGNSVQKKMKMDLGE